MNNRGAQDCNRLPHIRQTAPENLNFLRPPQFFAQPPLRFFGPRDIFAPDQFVPNYQIQPKESRSLPEEQLRPYYTAPHLNDSLPPLPLPPDQAPANSSGNSTRFENCPKKRLAKDFEAAKYVRDSFEAELELKQKNQVRHLLIE